MITSTHYRSLPGSLAVDLPIRLHEAPSSDIAMRRLTVAAILASALSAPPAIVYALFVIGEADYSSIGSAIYRFAAIGVAVIAIGTLLSKKLLPFLFRKLSRQRTITISDSHVSVREETLFGVREWREPLNDYAGLERHVYDTIDGSRQELVLSHPEPSRRVAVWVGDTVPDALITGFETILSRSTVRSRDE